VFGPGRTRFARGEYVIAGYGEDSSVDSEVVGKTGVVVVATRGPAGPGEVLVRLASGSQSYIARSDEPLAKGTSVLVVADLGGRTITVIPLSGSH
jgi:membrane protein implicated in regulation of membrane protease activity